MSFETKRMLVTVKAYPIVSKFHGAAVCTAGITEDGEWIRLFPVPFPLPREKNYKKYDWIEFKAKKAREWRKESYDLDRDGWKTIKIIDSLAVSDVRKETAIENWKKRKKIVLSNLSKSIEELEVKKEKDGTSLGVIKPKEVEDFFWVKSDKCTKWEKDLLNNTQRTLYGEYRRPVEKIPWVFRYKFFCDDSQCKGHNIMCEDWELIQCYRAWKPKYGENTLEKIKEKYFDDFFDGKRDTYFYMGTDFRWGKFLIVGLFYPPKGI